MTSPTANDQPDIVWHSALQTRFASAEMLELWSDARRARLWRSVWLAVAKAQKELGVNIPQAAIDDMGANLDSTDFASVARHENRLRHDVMAHVHAFGESAPAARGFIHLGMTSQDVVCNADAVLLRSALEIIAGKLARIIDRVATFAHTRRNLPCLGYTHFQPAQPLTLGKRATLWGQDFAIALQDIQLRIAGVKLKGLRGATGTQFSFLALLGDAAKVERMEATFCDHLNWNPEAIWSVCGQTSPRLHEATVLNSLAACACAIHKCCNDIRLLCNLREVEEPFERDQIGSSAMPYKRNPMRCERATGLARFVMGLAPVAMATASEQWLERTLDDSSARRLSLPEAFLALDGALDVMINVIGGLVVNESVIAARLRDELPFVATEDILMAAVLSGVDREKAHDAIRRHALSAAERVKQGQPNDLAQRLSADPLFAKVDVAKALNPERLVGRSVQQTERWISSVAQPIRKQYAAKLALEPTLKV